MQTNNEQSEDRLTVIGIGASAGGLQALQAFFEVLPADTGMSFVVIMHLSPEHESLLAELLQAKTRMPVRQVTERTTIAPNHVYVIPPNKRLEATDDVLSTHDFEEPRGHRAPIDLFFRTMAAAYGDGAAIILSGGGTDGSVGLKAVKEAGGLVLVQAPEEAEHDSMPRAAIATGLVDIVLPVRELALRLVEVKQHPSSLPEGPDGLAEPQADALHHILAQLRLRSGHDFSAYKPTTVLRRLQRRMQVTQMNDLPAYLAYLRLHGEEVQALMKDLLIGVTNFFRDPEAFAALGKTVIPHLFTGKEAGDTVRVWVVGCSTGEEAYSIAILLAEEAATLEIRPKIQVFASDLDENALATAREGLYPLAIAADVSEERLGRYFEKEGDHYSVIREIRDKVLFASHSVLRDPPFSRLDLVSCRNLLIYLQRELQGQVFDVFHYALRPEGYLLLGNAETAESTTNLFQPLDKQHRLYQAKKRRGEMPLLPMLQHSNTPIARTAKEPMRREPEAEERLHRRALEAYAPPSLLVDADGHVIHLSERAGRYLQPAGGMFTNDITLLIRPALKGELQTALYQAFEKGTATVACPVAVQFNGTPHRVYLTVRPMHEAAERLALVIFNEDETGAPPPYSEGEVAKNGSEQRLEEELRHVRDRLQITSEEYESSREQMTAQNEELRSVNEEYKSTMEELETSKEEFQSLNEELETINNELNHKMVEVTRAHSDLQNLMEATEIGTLFLDRDLHIQRFTVQAEAHFNLVASDRGRPLSHLTHRFDYGRIEADAGRVLADLTLIEREIRDEDDRWFLVRMRPYRTVENKIDGVVITFVDITGLKQVEAAMQQLNETLEVRVGERTEQLQVLASKLTMAEQAERRRIAEILHDGLQQILYGIQMKMSFIREGIKAEEYDEALQQMEETEEGLEGAIDMTRRLAVDLSPPVLASEGLADTLFWLRTQLQESHNLTLEVAAEHAFYIANADMRVLLFQAIRELLLNVVKHAGVNHARVEITDQEGHMVIRVIDEGHGFDVAQLEDRIEQEGGFGLFSVRERIALFGGRMEIDSSPGQGTRVTIYTPIAVQSLPTSDTSDLPAPSRV